MNYKPCPFCGSYDIRNEGGYGTWWVECKHCQATGPSAGDPEDADKYWREREQPKEPK